MGPPDILVRRIIYSRMHPVLLLLGEAVGGMHSRFRPLKYFMSNGCNDGSSELLLATSGSCTFQNSLLQEHLKVGGGMLHEVSCSWGAVVVQAHGISL